MREIQFGSMFCVDVVRLCNMPMVARIMCFMYELIWISGEINEFMKMYAVNLAEKGDGQVGKPFYRAKIVLDLVCKRTSTIPWVVLPSGSLSGSQISSLILEFIRIH